MRQRLKALLGMSFRLADLKDLLKRNHKHCLVRVHTATITNNWSEGVKIINKLGLIEKSQKRDGKSAEPGEPGNIKISSIPSIPKKSATRVYE